MNCPVAQLTGCKQSIKFSFLNTSSGTQKKKKIMPSQNQHHLKWNGHISWALLGLQRWNLSAAAWVSDLNRCCPGWANEPQGKMSIFSQRGLCKLGQVERSQGMVKTTEIPRIQDRISYLTPSCTQRSWSGCPQSAGLCCGCWDTHPIHTEPQKYPKIPHCNAQC